jgi:hypothetical protein
VVATPESGDVRVHRRGCGRSSARACVRACLPASPPLRLTPRAPASRPRSAKLELGLLALEGVFTHNTRSASSHFSWRVGSAWDVGYTHVGRKQRLPSPAARFKPSARWDVATIKAPDLNGQLGDGAGGFACELGKFHLSLPRLQATLEL